MKAALSLILLGIAYSKKVHQFWAEHNFICSVCESGVKFSCLGGSLSNFKGCYDDTNTEFTPICSFLRKKESYIERMCNNTIPYDICTSLDLCGEWEEDKFDKLPAIDMDIVNEINSKNVGWKAGVHQRFKERTLGSVKRTTLGAVVDKNHVYKLKPQKNDKVMLGAPPTSFDTREKWPECVGVVGNIRDQSACGCCWAFGSTEAFNDRVCIVSGNTKTYTTLLSVEDTCACCTGAECGYSNGCNGGQPTAAWNWFKLQGVPTGGNYSDLNKTDTCEPFTLPPCAHHEPSQQYPDCPSREYRTPSCVKKCINTGYPVSWSNDKQYSEGSYSVRGVSKIEEELATYGSVSASFTVYQDFLTYKSGVYKHTSGGAVGGHAIKILGYGTENGQAYWLCANSWNDSWGDQGYFKILKGVDECGIESGVGAGHPKSS